MVSTFTSISQSAGNCPEYIREDSDYGGGATGENWYGCHKQAKNNGDLKGYTIALGRTGATKSVKDRFKLATTALYEFMMSEYPDRFFGAVMWETAHALASDQSNIGDYDSQDHIDGYNEVCLHQNKILRPAGYVFQSGVNFVSDDSSNTARASHFQFCYDNRIGVCGPDVDPTSSNQNTQDQVNGMYIGQQYYKYIYRQRDPMGAMFQVNLGGDGTSGNNNTYTTNDLLQFARLNEDSFTPPASTYPTAEGDYANFTLEVPYIYITAKNDSVDDTNDWESHVQDAIQAWSVGDDQVPDWNTLGQFNAFYGASNEVPGLQAQSATMSGIVAVEGAISSMGDLQAQSALMGGLVSMERKASGALQAQSAIMTGAATIEGDIASAGALQAQNATLSGSSIIARDSSGALQAQSAILSGAGTTTGDAQTLTSSGALVSQAATLAGLAHPEYTSTGVLQAQSATMVGSISVLGFRGYHSGDVTVVQVDSGDVTVVQVLEDEVIL